MKLEVINVEEHYETRINDILLGKIKEEEEIEKEEGILKEMKTNKDIKSQISKQDQQKIFQKNV